MYKMFACKSLPSPKGAAFVRNEIYRAQAENYVLDIGSAASRVATRTRVSREQAAEALISAGLDARISRPARTDGSAYRTGD